MSEIFKSDFFTVELSETPAVKGHLTVKNTKPLSSCSDDESLLFFAANSQCSTAVFELLQAHGTNVIINEKDDSLVGHILPRSQNDGVDFLWQPQRADGAELDSVAKSIKDAIDLIVWNKDNPKQKIESKEPETISESVDENGEKKTNYLLKKLHRTP